MRMIFGVLSLLFAVAVVGFLAKQQLRSVGSLPTPAVSAGASSASTVDASLALPSIKATSNVQQQSLQIQQQFKAAAEAAMQGARTEPDTR